MMGTALKLLWIPLALFVLSLTWLSGDIALTLWLKRKSNVVLKYLGLCFFSLSFFFVGELAARVKDTPSLHPTLWWAIWWVSIHLVLGAGLCGVRFSLAGILANGGEPQHSEEPTILVVDDEGLNLLAISTFLRDNGYNVADAAGGVEALMKVASLNPALVIADIVMPSMDGHEFVRRMRQWPGHSDTPVIFVTGSFSTREAETMAKRCGVNRVLIKPWRDAELLAAVRELLPAEPAD